MGSQWKLAISVFVLWFFRLRIQKLAIEFLGAVLTSSEDWMILINLVHQTKQKQNPVQNTIYHYGKCKT